MVFIIISNKSTVNKFDINYDKTAVAKLSASKATNIENCFLDGKDSSCHLQNH